MSISIDAGTFRDGVQISVATSQSTNTPLTIWRTVEGKNRAALRGAYQLTGHAGAISVLDFEIPYNIKIVYEVECAAEWAAAPPVTVYKSEAWLLDVLYPSKSIPLTLAVHNQAEREARTALLRPVGRRNPVAITDVREGQVGTSYTVTQTIREKDALLSLVDSNDILCLTGPATWELGPLYMVLLKVTESRRGEIFRPQRYWELEWVEVDPPSTLLYGTPALWTTVDNNTWLTTRQSQWVDVTYPVPGGGLLRAPQAASAGVRWDP